MLNQLRLLLRIVMLMPVVLTLMLLFVLSESADPFGMPELVPTAMVVIAAALAAGASATVGARTPALAPSTDRDSAIAASRQAFSSGVFLRFAICEAVALIGFVAGLLATSGGMIVCLLALVLAEVLLVVFAWPTERTIERVQASLERDGATSHLREGLTGSALPGRH